MPTGTAATSARKTHEQKVHTLRFTVNYNDSGIASGVSKQTLPQGAILVGTDVHVSAAFNAATTNVLTVGTNASTYDNIVAAADVTEGSTGLTLNIKPTGAALGPIASDLTVYAMYTQTGTAASAGKAYVIVKYVVDNDL